MKHIEKFNEHVYHKALATGSVNWAKNFEKLIAHITKEIEGKQIKDFQNGENEASFKINGRKYKIDKADKLFLYTKGKDEEVELKLTPSQMNQLITALKKPIKPSKTASKKGKKPYIEDEE